MGLIRTLRSCPAQARVIGVKVGSIPEGEPISRTLLMLYPRVAASHELHRPAGSGVSRSAFRLPKVADQEVHPVTVMV